MIARSRDLFLVFDEGVLRWVFRSSHGVCVCVCGGELTGASSPMFSSGD